MWLALLIFGIFPLIILFLFRKPIIENIKMFYETKEPVELYDYHINSTEYFGDISDSLILDLIRIELLKKFENIQVSIPYTWVSYEYESNTLVVLNEGDILEIIEVNDSNMVVTLNNDTLIFKRISQ
jgi:hypothetical protein